MSSSADTYAYASPAPEVVLRIVEGYGSDAAWARWHWLKPSTVNKLAQAGRELRRPAGAPPSRGARRRRTTVEQEERAVARASELGSASAAARECGLTLSMLRTLHRERGIPLPILSHKIRGAKSAATRKARALKELAHA